MTSIKLKVRLKSSGAPSFYFQVIHKRKVRQFKSPYETENESLHLLSFLENQLLILTKNSPNSFSLDSFVSSFSLAHSDTSFIAFMFLQVSSLKQDGHIRSSETCLAALRSFQKFLNFSDINIASVTASLIKSYDKWLVSSGVKSNTRSFYLRQLRTCYNKAVNQNLTPDLHPFDDVFTGIDKTPKRALSINELRRLISIPLNSDNLIFARDMFLLSFYLRGISFIDLAYLKKNNFVGNYISYHRKKTNQFIDVFVERKTKELLSYYHNSSSIFLLPIITTNDEFFFRSEYLNALTRINRSLKKIGQMLHFQIPLTMYVARHSWASIARSLNVNISVISQALGHTNESTTMIYLDSISNVAVNNANRKILSMF